MEKANGADLCGASVIRGAGDHAQADAHGVYVVECRDADGKLKWTDHIDNLVTTGGKNFALDAFLAGVNYSAAWYMGLISSTSYSAVNAADTMSSHAGWLEAGAANAPTYSQTTRPAPTFSAANAGAKATASAVVFSITGTGTVKGCFLSTNSAKDGTAGTLYSAGLFSAGDKAVGNGDTLSCTYQASL